MGHSPIAAGLENEPDGFFAGSNPVIQSLQVVIAEIAPTSIPVLLVGESGTGKQMFARRIHQLSARGSQPFIKIACATTKPESFAVGSDRNGNSDLSSAGTVFFDKIGELDAASQRSLLCVLPDGDGHPGAESLLGRVVSSTSRSLDDEMNAGRFRSELYYRINGVCLRLPPLRERKADIPALADFFISKHAAQFGRPRPFLRPETVSVFMDYSWPGNIRQLESTIKSIVALGDQEIVLSELVTPPHNTRIAVKEIPNPSLKVAARAASREAERELILKALARTRWNRKRAAQDLQISYKSLLYKLKQIGLEESDAN